MLLASLALLSSLPGAAPVRAATVPCNPDPMKSIACAAQRHAPARRPAAQPAPAPLACNPDPLKGAACHAHVALARAKERSKAERGARVLAAD